MDSETDISALVMSIRQAFPDAADMTDHLRVERGFEKDDELHWLWLEALADVTNDLMHQRRQVEVDALLTFFSCQHDGGSGAEKKAIDVCYVENLMWNLETADKKWAWPRFPGNLKALYVAMWGGPKY